MDNDVKDVNFDILNDAADSVVGSEFFKGMLETILRGSSVLSVRDCSYKIVDDTVVLVIVFNLIPSLENFEKFCAGLDGVSFDVLLNKYVEYHGAFIGGRVLLMNYLLMDLLGDYNVMLFSDDDGDIFIGEQSLKGYIDFDVRVSSDVIVDLSNIMVGDSTDGE